jgi:ribosomal protein S11
MKQKVTRGLLAAAFAGAMGFGAAQAFAAPAAAMQAAACQQDVCTRKCADQGLTGICSGRGCYCR